MTVTSAAAAATSASSMTVTYTQLLGGGGMAKDAGKGVGKARCKEPVGKRSAGATSAAVAAAQRTNGMTVTYTQLLGDGSAGQARGAVRLYSTRRGGQSRVGIGRRRKGGEEERRCNTCCCFC